MQNTRNEFNELRQAIFSAVDEVDVQRLMDEDIRVGEVVESRRKLSDAEFRSFNRHERRKAEKLARKKR